MKNRNISIITGSALWISMLAIIISCTGGASKHFFNNNDLKQLINYTPGKSISGKYIDRKSTDTSLYSSAHIRQLLIDKNNYLWYGTYLLGFSVYTGEMQFRFETPTGTNGNIVRKLIEDRNGDIWMATNYGLMVYNHTLPADMPDSYTRYTMKEGLPSNQVWSLCNDPRGGIWIGTENGLSHFDGENFSTYTLPEACAQPSDAYASSDAVMCLAVDANGLLWIGTNGRGIFTCNPAAIQSGFKRYTSKQGLCGDIIHCIMPDKHGHIWIGTRDGGISTFDGKTFTNYNTGNGLSNNFVWTLTEDQFGQIWIGTAGSGVMCFNGKFFTSYDSKDGLANNYVQSILEDSNGHIWFGTGMGITRYTNNHRITVPVKTNAETNEANQHHMQSFPEPMRGC